MKETYKSLADVQTAIEALAQTQGSASQFCAIAPGLQQVFTGLQSILDGVITDPKSQGIIDGVFGAVKLALQIAQSTNCS